VAPLRTRGRFAPYVVGTALLALACALALFAAGAPPPATIPGGSRRGGLGAGVGLPLRWVGRTGTEPTRREALLAVLALWLAVPLVGLRSPTSSRPA
jgi:hypothetical protein